MVELLENKKTPKQESRWLLHLLSHFAKLPSRFISADNYMLHTTEKMNAQEILFRNTPLYYIGWILVGTGIVCNEWVLTKAFSADGMLETDTRMAIWSLDILFISIGLCLIKSRKLAASTKVIFRVSHSYPRTLAVSIGVLLTIVMLLCGEGIFYFLNNHRKLNAVNEASWIRRGLTDDDRLSGNNPLRRVRGSIVRDPLLGFKPPPNAAISETKTLGGRLVYNATYSTDAYSRRLTPIENIEHRSYFMLFFGCSYTFGEGVNDNETMPFYFAQYASKSRPYNYGIPGAGPQEMLAKLQSGQLAAEINEQHGILVYTFIDHHINRAIGTMDVYNSWGWAMPFYTIDANNKLVRKGNFASGRPGLALLYRLMDKSQILKYFNVTIPPLSHDDSIRITARMIEESRNVFREQFHNGEFYVLLYPGVRRGKEMLKYFQQSGVKYLDYSGLMDLAQSSFRIEGDTHPTAKAHRLVAAQLARDLDISGSN